MKNLERLFDLIRHCELNRVNTTLDRNVYGFRLTIYLHDNLLENTMAILSVLKIRETDCSIGIRDNHFDDSSVMRVITIETERA